MRASITSSRLETLRSEMLPLQGRTKLLDQDESKPHLWGGRLCLIAHWRIIRMAHQLSIWCWELWVSIFKFSLRSEGSFWHNNFLEKERDNKEFPGRGRQSVLCRQCVRFGSWEVHDDGCSLSWVPWVICFRFLWILCLMILERSSTWMKVPFVA